MAEYKSRRERRQAKGGKIGEGKAPSGIALIIGITKKPKAGGSVEGSKARAHLGKRARGMRADGGATKPKFEVDDDSSKNMGDLGAPKSKSDYKNDSPGMGPNRAPSAEHDLKRGGRAQRASGGALGKQLDAREAAFSPDGIDKVAKGEGSDEREVPVQERKRGGRLTAHERQAMPSSEFALPGKGEGPGGKGAGSYPIPDPSHARAALSRVSANGTPAEKATVRAAVHRRYPGIK